MCRISDQLLVLILVIAAACFCCGVFGNVTDSCCNGLLGTNTNGCNGNNGVLGTNTNGCNGVAGVNTNGPRCNCSNAYRP